MLRVFIGTDQRMKRAERVLEYSIRKHCKGKVDITWMRAHDKDWGLEWHRGRPEGALYTSQGWATDFTCFRFAVPEMCGFAKHAIYLDVDMIVLRDLQEILALRTDKACTAMSNSMDVLLWNCTKVGSLPWWPSISAMKAHSDIRELTMMLRNRGELVLGADPLWDVRDKVTESAKLVHYTNMRTQPWKPWPEVFMYPDVHPDEGAQQLWDTYEREAEDALTTAAHQPREGA